MILDSGALGRAAVPSGASTGTREAVELRDGDKKRYGGKGVLKAVEHVNTVLRRRSSARTRAIRRPSIGRMIELDGTENKARLGANALLASRSRMRTPPRLMHACRCTGILARAASP